MWLTVCDSHIYNVIHGMCAEFGRRVCVNNTGSYHVIYLFVIRVLFANTGVILYDNLKALRPENENLTVVICSPEKVHYNILLKCYSIAATMYRVISECAVVGMYTLFYYGKFGDYRRVLVFWFPSSHFVTKHGPLTWYVKLWVAHAPEMPPPTSMKTTI